ncbi:MAG TPA: hypothetical protein VNV17_05035, partial [Solirubrobacteraceae bacterium]|nr:hypothetical protein [Solirubrobacteraceae bacterium]
MTIHFRGTRVGLSALAAAALAMGAAACGSTSSSGGGTQSSSSTASQSSAATSTAEATNSAAATSSAATSSAATGGGATAAPGTSLKIGQSATVPFTTTLKSGKNGPTYKLSVQVQSMDKGTLADFNGVQLDATEKASTP